MNIHEHNQHKPEPVVYHLISIRPALRELSQLQSLNQSYKSMAVRSCLWFSREHK